ncbi:PH domain-containing protein [uncultured Erythrobacter sp.]|uniref:PH domain-containing protein n=1 Tax=uncultured Erythrobacter sp. TaxID=263913 RepID=UPI002635F090|nr:PH domain-containing protein [uncultured Erythrobacter sp.]
MSATLDCEPINPAGSASAEEAGLRTHPKSFIIRGLSILSQLIIPLGIASVTIFDDGSVGDVLMFAVPAVSAIIGINFAFAYLGWKRLTYTVGEQDIRVESGVLSRSARSVPFERIQDVSLEEPLLPRLFGLVIVKFETGAGAGEDISLSYLSGEEGDRLRQLVRQRRDGEVATGSEESATGAEAITEPEAQTLFAMDPRRLLIFGTFEFSLAVFAVLGGLFQYADSFVDFEIWDPELWESWLSEQGTFLSSFGAYAQIFSAVAGLIAVFVIGSATGLIRTFTREWGFLLERTARGFRRRRGLFTKTDVVMPVHRVQGVKIGTGLLRYRFGWHGLRFVSLAQDSGGANHVVAPFAKMDEIAPIVAEAGFHLPDEDTDWHRASERYRIDSAIIDSVFFILAAIIAGTATSIFAPDWVPLAVAIPLALAVLGAAAALYSWQFHRHAIDADQIMANKGLFAPTSQLATRMKLHSVEIAQGPISRRRGYATLHLGLAGGEFEIPGVPIERAREVRREVMTTIAATDFSQLEQA